LQNEAISRDFHVFPDLLAALNVFQLEFVAFLAYEKILKLGLLELEKNHENVSFQLDAFPVIDDFLHFAEFAFSDP